MKQHLLTLFFVVLSLFTSLNMFGATTSSDAIDLKVTQNNTPTLFGTDSETPVVTAVNDAPVIEVTANDLYLIARFFHQTCKWNIERHTKCP